MLVPGKEDGKYVLQVCSRIHSRCWSAVVLEIVQCRTSPVHSSLVWHGPELVLLAASVPGNWVRHRNARAEQRLAGPTWQCSFMAARRAIWKMLRRTQRAELMEASSSSTWHLGRRCARSLAASALPGSCTRVRCVLGQIHSAPVATAVLTSGMCRGVSLAPGLHRLYHHQASARVNPGGRGGGNSGHGASMQHSKMS